MSEAPRKVLFDVGAHFGESLCYALDPRYEFDLIFAFEPSPRCWDHLEKFRDPRLRICRFGLGPATEDRPLFGSGQIGASLFPDKAGIDASIVEQVQIKRVSEWMLSEIKATDQVYVKINCEGSELEILRELSRDDVRGRIMSVILTPDLLKVESLRNNLNQLHEVMSQSSFPCVLRDERHTSKQFEMWLKSTGEKGFGLKSLKFLAGFGQPWYFVLRQRLAEGLPPWMSRILFSAFGRKAWKRRLRRVLQK